MSLIRLLVTLSLLLLSYAYADTTAMPPTLNFTSPENALKSYWAAKDWYSVSNHPEVLERTSADQAMFLKKMAEVTMGETRKYFLSWEPGPPYRVSRTIKSISEESPSRVVAMVNIKNATPIPAGLTPSASESAVREAGQNYKYIIENNNGVWKVSEVWRLGIPGISFRAYQVYESSPTLSFPSSVYDD